MKAIVLYRYAPDLGRHARLRFSLSIDKVIPTLVTIILSASG